MLDDASRKRRAGASETGDKQMTEYLATSQVARELGVSVGLVRLWVRTGRLAHVKTPLGALVPTEEVSRVRRERYGVKAPAAA